MHLNYFADGSEEAPRWGEEKQKAKIMVDYRDGQKADWGSKEFLAGEAARKRASEDALYAALDADGQAMRRRRKADTVARCRERARERKATEAAAAAGAPPPPPPVVAAPSGSSRRTTAATTTTTSSASGSPAHHRRYHNHYQQRQWQQPAHHRRYHNHYQQRQWQ